MIHDPARIDDTALDIQEHNTRHARLRSRGFASGDGLKRALGRVAAPLAGIWGEFDAVAMPDIRARLDVLRAIDPGLMEAVIPGAATGSPMRRRRPSMRRCCGCWRHAKHHERTPRGE
jgi:hypothetical protein